MAAGEVWLKIYHSSRVKLRSPGAVMELIMAKKRAELTVPVQALGERRLQPAVNTGETSEHPRPSPVSEGSVNVLVEFR